MFESRPPDTELPRVLADFARELDTAMMRAESATEPTADPKRRRRSLIAPLIAAAAVVAVAAILLAGSNSSVPALTTEEAVADVAHAATNAKPLGPGEFLYTKSNSSQLWSYGRTIDALGRLVGPTAVIESKTQSTWINIDAPGRFLTVEHPLRFPTAGDGVRAKQQISAWHARNRRSDSVQARIARLSEKTGLPTDTYPAFVSPEPNAGTFDANGHFQIGDAILSPEQLNAYPTDPQVIYNRIRDRIAAGNAKFVKRQLSKGRPRPQTIDADVGVWDSITEPMLWFNLPLPPKVRANLVRALGEIPGVTSANDERDPRGRPGIALTLELQGTRRVAIFDPDSGALLSLKSVLVNPKVASGFNHQQDLARLPAGTIQREYLLLEEAVVNKLPDIKNPDGPISRFRQGL